MSWGVGLQTWSFARKTWPFEDARFARRRGGELPPLTAWGPRGIGSSANRFASGPHFNRMLFAGCGRRYRISIHIPPPEFFDFVNSVQSDGLNRGDIYRIDPLRSRTGPICGSRLLFELIQLHSVVQSCSSSRATCGPSNKMRESRDALRTPRRVALRCGKRRQLTVDYLFAQ